jgi:hypothetical protein
MQLTDPKGQSHLITLRGGASFQATARGRRSCPDGQRDSLSSLLHIGAWMCYATQVITVP